MCYISDNSLIGYLFIYNMRMLDRWRFRTDSVLFMQSMHYNKIQVDI